MAVLSKLQGDLENLVDQHGMEELLRSLCVVALAKEDHVRENWQDNSTAQVWNRIARHCERISNLIRPYDPSRRD
jgi:hypothetical protein